MVKYKREKVFGNVSPSGKYYNQTVSGYGSIWRVGRNRFDEVISEKSLKINVRLKRDLL